MTNARGRLPDFFIVGAMKAGTTTLYDWLRRHPDLFLPDEKEPFYFLWPDGVARFQLPTASRLITAENWMVIRTEHQYRSLFARAGADQRIGEASTFYLPDPDAAARIKSACPDAQIITILRDPVERAHSAYWFQQSLGLEPAGSFRAAIMAELRGEREDWLYGWRHVHCGRYAAQIERYFRHFGEERVLVLKFEDLRADVRAVVRRVLTFLGVNSQILPECAPAANVTAIPRSGPMRQVKFLFSRPNPLKDTVKRAVPRPLRRRIRQTVFAAVDRYSARPPALVAADRALLQDLFEPEHRRLECLLGRRFTQWSAA
ncbi:sulfotransferase family protein [Rhodoligotrophos defluvii]|uniref:sulfotransferase family protein n=1 Tax=Rhodoligotrophos defluvii TaxID=2561934 RepID=UPI0010C9CAC6|nr:sulfotransferase [Rhodoligotrophos defluvii]